MDERGEITRRGFLRGAAGTCALPSIVPAFALGQGGTEAPSNRITMACIGVGGRGKENLRSFLGHQNCRIVAVCDVNANRVEEAKKTVNDRYGSVDCVAYRDYRELLARGDIDAVSIATPDAWHALQSVEAARAGKDIFLEKPLGLSVRDDIALVSAVGVGMRSQWGVAEKMFGALAQAKVNIDSITTSEIRISCAVDREDVERALEAVCLAFELDRPARQRKPI